VKFRPRASDRVELYATINNVFNAEPPLQASGQAGFALPTVVSGGQGIDPVGRYFAVGTRVLF